MISCNDDTLQQTTEEEKLHLIEKRLGVTFEECDSISENSLYVPLDNKQSGVQKHKLELPTSHKKKKILVKYAGQTLTPKGSFFKRNIANGFDLELTTNLTIATTVNGRPRRVNIGAKFNFNFAEDDYGINKEIPHHKNVNIYF